ncbi:hypothetical protein ACHAWF_004905 [Thalassiosira exigua]
MGSLSLSPLFIIILSTAPTAASSLNARAPPDRIGTMTGGDGRGSGASTTWPSMRLPSSSSDADDAFARAGRDDVGASSSASVPAIMNYVSPDTVDISTRRDLSGSDGALVGAIWDPSTVRVRDARREGGAEATPMTLDANGFELRAYPEGCEDESALRSMDFLDQDRVAEDYYPTCERLVRDALASQASAVGASSPGIACVRAFDHNVRCGDPSSLGEIKAPSALRPGSQGADAEAAAPQVQNAAGLVHADYTRISAPRRLRDLANPPKLNDVLRPKLGQTPLLEPTAVREALEGGIRRYAFVNVWRNIDPDCPVANPPLACVDASTATFDDLRTFRIHYTDRVGENYFACAPRSSEDRRHSWHYYPDMTMREALLLKQWDSAGGIARGADQGKEGISTFTIHSAFLDPTRSKCPPRKSIEVRCVVIWERESED